MWPFSQIGNAIRSYWTDESSARPEEAKPVGQLLPGAITSTTVSSIRSTLEAHEGGSFAESARLAEYLLRDSDLKSAMNQRVDGLLGLPFKLEQGRGRWSVPALREVKERWQEIAPRKALSDVVRSAIFLGFGAAQIVWTGDQDGNRLIPRIDPWHPSNVWLDGNGVFWATTAQGIVPITPGYGWLLYTPASCYRPQFYGAITAVAPWVLRSDYSARDASRWSEVHGQGTWVAKTPSGSRKQDSHSEFLASIRNIGRAAVIPLPQGQTPEQSYGLELVEAKADGWQGFEFLLNRAGRAIRLAILGQDMTSVSGPAGGSYAQSKVGDRVRQDVKDADAQSLAECLRTQLLKPYASYLYGAPSAAPTPCWDAAEPEDLSASAVSLETLGRAITAWKKNGANVDVVALAAKYGMPLVEAQQLIEPTEPQPQSDNQSQT